LLFPTVKRISKSVNS